jgi:phosphoribosyl 1,2-cyclic phosphodiesterase
MKRRWRPRSEISGCCRCSSSDPPPAVRYGGNTSSVEVRGADGTRVLDAGTGIQRLGATIDGDTARIDVLLTHLHMDHIQGLGFFDPLFRPDGGRFDLDAG